MFAESGRIEMHMHVDGAGGGDHPLAIAHRGGCRNDKPRIDPIHDGRVAGLAEADDAAVFDAEVALHNTDHRIDDQDVTEEKIERALRARYSCGKTDAVAKRFAAAVQTFIAVNGVILLDHREQRRIGQADAVADRRTVKSGIISAPNSDHDLPHAPLKPASRARRSAASRTD